MIRFEEALARIVALGEPPLSSELVPLEDADGRVLAEDVVAGVDLPRFDYSAMDGYALSTSALTGSPPSRWRVQGESRTGVTPDPLAAGTTMRIFTGAAIPSGADAVVMQEHVTRDGDFAVITNSPRSGQFIRRRGDDMQAGATALRRGTRLRPAHLSLAAALDVAELPLRRRPEVAILATGDELRRPGTEGVPGTIPESNTIALRTMSRRAGATSRAMPFVRDDRDATERAFAAALEVADVVVTVGGVSVGDHDLVRPALEAIGVKLEFWRVAIKPGKPLAVGRFPRAGRRDAIVLGLPGNPASAIVTFGIFGTSLLRALQGDGRPAPPTHRARMTRAHAHDPGRLELARGTLSKSEDGHLMVTTGGNQASGAITSMASADALVVLPSEANGVPAGADVDVYLARDLCF